MNRRTSNAGRICYCRSIKQLLENDEQEATMLGRTTRQVRGICAVCTGAFFVYSWTTLQKSENAQEVGTLSSMHEVLPGSDHQHEA